MGVSIPVSSSALVTLEDTFEPVTTNGNAAAVGAFS